MTITDEQLRAEMQAGAGPSEVATKYGVSRQYASKRMQVLRQNATALAVVAPVESRQFVSAQVDALGELTESLKCVKLLLAACDDWLRDAHDPRKYDIGARSHEILVTYWEAEDDKIVKAKAPLQELLARVDKGGILTIAAESKFADPRELVLKTAQEVRQTVQCGVELMKLLSDARMGVALREALLSAIAEVEPDVAEAIARAIRRTIVLYHAAE